MAFLVECQQVTPYSILQSLDTHSDIAVVLSAGPDDMVRSINNKKHENDQFRIGVDTAYTPMANPFQDSYMLCLSYISITTSRLQILLWCVWNLPKYPFELLFTQHRWAGLWSQRSMWSSITWSCWCIRDGNISCQVTGGCSQETTTCKLLQGNAASFFFGVSSSVRWNPILKNPKNAMWWWVLCFVL